MCYRIYNTCYVISDEAERKKEVNETITERREKSRDDVKPCRN